MTCIWLMGQMLFSISHCKFYGTRFATTHDKQSPLPLFAR